MRFPAHPCNARSIKAARPLLGILAAFLLCSSTAYPQAAPSQESSAFKITGVVVSEHGGAPVPNCHLTATRSGAGSTTQRTQRSRNGQQSGDSTPSTNTDDSGHFSLSVPSAGSWQLYGSAVGFRMQGYDRHENFFSAVVLTSGAPVYDLTFVLEPDSAISGFVRDEAGEAVRNARVTLFAAESGNPDLPQGGSVRSSTTTDDRGHYEFAGLAPGEYSVGVQAEPWYAAAAVQGRRLSIASGASPDPSLDVVYPQVWFPGVTERQSAEALSLHHGEVREADFNLTPAPATHLHISPPAPAGGQRGQFFPLVERVSSEGLPFTNTSTQVDGQGQIDVGGLSPGLYRVTLQGPGGPQPASFIRVPSGDQHSLDLSAAIPVADLTLHLDGDGDSDRVQVILTDIDTGSTFVSYRQGNLQRRRNTDATPAPTGDRKLEVPPARYRVTFAADNETYLAGITIKNTPVAGRIVTVGSGSTLLNLKLTRGRASVRGVASLSGKPLVAAMVMLVPATFGQPGSITMLRRDQTNTDGSFLIESVIPGDYILLAIDRGWTVNWHDPATLQRYLIHGIPVALEPSGAVKQDLDAQTP